MTGYQPDQQVPSCMAASANNVEWVNPAITQSNQYLLQDDKLKQKLSIAQSPKEFGKTAFWFPFLSFSLVKWQ